MRTFSCDIETDGLNPKIIWCIAVHNIDNNKTIVFNNREEFNTLELFKLWLLSEVDVLVFHNGIGFRYTRTRKTIGC